MTNAVPNPVEMLPVLDERPSAGAYFPVTYRIAYGTWGAFRVWPGTVEDKCPPFVRTSIAWALTPSLNPAAGRVMATLKEGFKSRWRYKHQPHGR